MGIVCGVRAVGVCHGADDVGARRRQETARRLGKTLIQTPGIALQQGSRYIVDMNVRSNLCVSPLPASLFVARGLLLRAART